MKLVSQISSIIIALLFVFTINFKTFVTLSFYVNQSEIAELFCINKEKPELKCDGKCHLATQIEKVETDEENTPFTPHNTTYELEVQSIITTLHSSLNKNNLEAKQALNTSVQATPCKGFYTIKSPPPKFT